VSCALGDVQGPPIDLPEQRTLIDDVPHAVADLFETDVFALEHLAQEGLLRVEAEPARGTDATDFQMRGIAGRRPVLRKGPRRGPPQRARRAVADPLVWASRRKGIALRRVGSPHWTISATGWLGPAALEMR
jgi:hypothetical protein